MKINLTAVLVLAAGLMVGCNETNKEVDSAGDVRALADEDTAVMYDENNLMAGSVLEADEEEFKSVNFDAPEIEEAELKNAGVGVRGENNYRIYSFEEDVMFATDKAEIQPSGEEKLQAFVDYINKRGTEATIRVYGFTDARASAAYNEELGRERATAVQNWILNNSQLDKNRMKVVSIGEELPEATNATPEGRQQNRRVEIVVVEKS
ncbi:OmpA family protein [Pontibacter toksunensis]|uniref:OmpA family protein n=1 Tax=Pontibacter toksunensis TaxID=1332631 RepID=A0ABW6C0W9_9BACT